MHPHINTAITHPVDDKNQKELETALIQVCKQGDHKRIKALLSDQDIDVNAKDIMIYSINVCG